MRVPTTGTTGTRIGLPAALAACAGAAACYHSTIDLSGPRPDTPDARDGTAVEDARPPDDAWMPETAADDATGAEDSPPVIDVPDAPDVPTDCVPVLRGPWEVERTAADGEERPVVLRSGDGFVTFTRPPGLVSADALRFERFAFDGSVSPAVWTISSVELGPRHPLVELPDGTFATAFAIPSGTESGIWAKIVPGTGMSGEVPRQVPGTEGAGEPDLTFDGTYAVLIWNQPVPSTYPDEFRATRIDTVRGEPVGSSVSVISGDYSEPRVIWAGICLLVTYVRPAGLHVLRLDDWLAVLDERRWSPEGEATIVGDPAVAWNGDYAAIVFEVRGGSGAALMLATARCGEPIAGTPTPLDPLVLSVEEPGEVSITWAEEAGEWGIAWTHVEDDGGRDAALARVSGEDLGLVEGPVVVSGGAAATHPAIAFNAGYYAVAWVEAASGVWPVYLATRGCVR